jgi:hypothetical protein
MRRQAINHYGYWRHVALRKWLEICKNDKDFHELSRISNPEEWKEAVTMVKRIKNKMDHTIIAVL